MIVLKTPSNHGGQIRGQTAGAQGADNGRFGQMFSDPTLDRPVLDQATLLALADVMTKSGVKLPDGSEDVDDGKPIRDMTIGGEAVKARDAGDENVFVPAGYTYFAQFVDHDISFDLTAFKGQKVDTSAVVDFRTPAIDLDSVYGGGPDTQPYLYSFDDKGFARLRTGDDLTAAGGSTVTKHDHLRLGIDPAAKGTPGAANRAAVIGDKRNDENKIVAQMHTCFIALHNRLMGDTATLQKMGGTNLDDAGERFKTVVKAARWHYQWVVLNDFLRLRMCETGMVDEVLNHGAPRLGFYAANNPTYAYIPVEFAVAAYRMGHSMVRPTYALNADVGTKGVFAEKRIPIFKRKAGPTEAMNGFGQAVPPTYGIDWSFFVDGLRKPADATMVIPQPSYRLDASLADPLRNLPEFENAADRAAANLAFRNLLRSQMDQLPSGEAVANALKITPLGPDKLWAAGSANFMGDKLDDDRKALDASRKAFVKAHPAITGHTPLWYYILREAEVYGTTRDATDPFGGQHLGPVGSRILAETFVGLLWFDETSYLRSPTAFKPVLPGAVDGSFGLADLIRYALG